MTNDPLHEESDLDGMLAVADHLVFVTSGGKEFVAAANEGDEHALYWVSRLERYGRTYSLLRDIYRVIRDVRMTARMVLDRDVQNFVYQYEWPEEQDLDIEVFYAFTFGGFVKMGLLDGLKRCELQECRKYFLGGPRAKWCSDTCGSKVRVRNKRRRDKEGQMMV